MLLFTSGGSLYIDRQPKLRAVLDNPAKLSCFRGSGVFFSMDHPACSSYLETSMDSPSMPVRGLGVSYEG